MRKCRKQDLIDEYLLDKLKPEEQADFEEHYFICRSCFDKMSERNEIVQVLRKEGVLSAAEGLRAGQPSPGSRLDRVFAFLTPRRLAVAGVSAAALLLAVWLLIPRTGTVSPPLVLTDDGTVRGATISVLSPVAEVMEAPAILEWKKVGDDIEYKVSLAGKSPLMSASTKETRIILPDEIRAKMKPGQTYSWQVQAFKTDGTLVAESKRTRFRILPKS